MRLSAALFFILSCPTSSSSTLSSSCLAADGSRVDWWFALKHPGGDRYSYLDSEEAEGGGEAAARLEVGLGSTTDGPLARTLLQLYRRPRRPPAPGPPPAPLPWHVIWNDQPSPSPSSQEDETGPSFYFAHSKGVLAIDDDGDDNSSGGFFLSHSAPHFPNDPGHNGGYLGLLRPQRRFSQHFLCVSLGSSGMENLTGHLSRAFRPRAFSVALPARRRESRSLEAAAAFAAGALPLAPTSSAEVRTVKGKELLLLATAGGPSFPLWDTVVASALAADAAAAAALSSPSGAAPRLLPPLAVQSWIRTEGAAPPKCQMPLPDASESSPLLPSVLGIRRVSFGRRNSSGGGGGSWSSEEAHAKFGVALGGVGEDDDRLSFSCVGDTNRDAPWRAGGAACVRWPGLRRLLASGVEEVDACADERLARE